MNAFEKIRERLEIESDEANDKIIEQKAQCDMAYYDGFEDGCDKAIEIVNQVEAEFNQSLANINQLLTNADRIRSMTDEELVELLFEQTNCDYCNIRTKCRQSDANDCHDVFLAWLQSKVEE